jgi:GNAT superfamily N-acetyltransferase
MPPAAGRELASLSMGDSVGDELVYTLPTDARARPLIADLARDYDERYGLNDGIPSSFELQRYPADLFAAESGGAFLLVLRDGEAIAGGAFKRVDDGTAEMKRVWTHPDFRRRGLARVVMSELEREAAARGYSVAELTTGARQPEAVALYLALGYLPLFDLDGDYEEIGYLGFRKALTVTDP